MMLRGVVGRGASPKHHDTFYPPEVYTIRSHGADGFTIVLRVVVVA
jgi:hypothetical protein